MNRTATALGLLALLLLPACRRTVEQAPEATGGETPQALGPPAEGRKRVVLAGGCFWCTEAVFEQLAGVTAVVSGYAGGTAKTAHYELVGSGTTGHAESIAIDYDPERITYEDLLEVFFNVAHDPTQLDYQGPDHGHQYRSAIFYANEEQRRVAQATIERLDASGAFRAPIVTTLEPLEAFYPAEAYHQDFVERNPHHPYVVRWSLPKLEKLRAKHPELLKARAG